MPRRNFKKQKPRHTRHTTLIVVEGDKANASPVAYLSESHLDTLGLCLFLALEKRENPGNKILCLDDAIASEDEAHMERLYELLLREAPHFHHVIISSHYQPLRFKFRWGILTQSKVEFLELDSAMQLSLS